MVFGEAARSGTMLLNRRLRGYGSAGSTRPRAPARDSKKPRMRRLQSINFNLLIIIDLLWISLLHFPH